jgi:hypothetical protein
MVALSRLVFLPACDQCAKVLLSLFKRTHVERVTQHKIDFRLNASSVIDTSKEILYTLGLGNDGLVGIDIKNLIVSSLMGFNILLEIVVLPFTTVVSL